MNTPSKFINDELVEQTVSNTAYASFTYNTNEDAVKHRFLISSRALDTLDVAHIKLDNGKNGPSNYLRLQAIPYGILFQAVYMDSQWVLASPNNCSLNDMTFGSNTTVIQKFEKMLQTKELTLESLDKASVYSFVLGCNDFSLFPLSKEYLILRSIYKFDADNTN